MQIVTPVSKPGSPIDTPDHMVSSIYSESDPATGDTLAGDFYLEAGERGLNWIEFFKK